MTRATVPGSLGKPPMRRAHDAQQPGVLQRLDILVR